MRLLTTAAMLAAGTGVLQAKERSMTVGGLTSQPIGHFEYCRRNPEECQPLAESGPESLDKAAWTAVRKLNRKVNSEIKARSDREIHGKDEVWSLPVRNSGDCEDYALLKRRLLIEELGFSPSNLLMTVVKRRNDDGHAILVLRTTEGDYMLDNLDQRVRLWTAEKDYRFLKRQSSAHAGKWVDIDGPSGAVTASGANR